MANTTERDPKLDACDKEIAEVLAKYGKSIRPVPFIDHDGRIAAQVIYFDTPVPEATPETAPETPKEEATSPLVTPE